MDNSPAFFQIIFGDVDALLSQYLIGTVSTLMDSLQPVALTCFAIYIAIFGYMHITNKIEQPVVDFARIIIKAGLITTFTLKVGVYTEYIVDFVMNTPAALTSLLTSESPGAANGYSSTAEVLDKLLGKGFLVGKEAWDSASVWKNGWGMYLVSTVFYAATVLLVTVAAILLLISQFALTILLILGPIFILLLLFGSTKNLFTQWITSLMNYMMTYVITVLIVSLIFDILGSAFDHIDVAKGPAAAAQILIMSIIGAVILLQASNLGSSLAGGIGLNTAGFGGAATRLGMGGLRRVTGGGRTSQELKNMRAQNKAQRIMENGGRLRSASRTASKAFRRRNTISG